MRMFLVVMCDIFLMLYLTAAINTTPGTALTVEDFLELKSMHETLELEKVETEAEFQEKLDQAQEEKERLLAEKKKQYELAAAKLAAEKARLKDMEQSLELSDAERERINNDLRIKEEILNEREQLLSELNKKIEVKEEMQRKMQEAYQTELKKQKLTTEESQKLAEQFKNKADNAEQLAEQMKEEAHLAHQAAETAKTDQQKAIALKEKAETEKQEALNNLKVTETHKEQAEQKAQKLAKTIKDIKQDGEAAYQKNMRPKLQTVYATYKRDTQNNTFTYKRALTLLPVKINEKIYAIFPSSQIGFTSRSDKAPDKLKIKYLDEPVTNGLIHKEDNLIAIPLADYQGKSEAPYPRETETRQLMPALLSLRNNGNKSLTDKIRGIADDYFVVNRDYLELDQNGELKFSLSGFRGTGTRAEHIVLGDQLVDLNGRLIGIANRADRIVRIHSLDGWTETTF